MAPRSLGALRPGVRLGLIGTLVLAAGSCAVNPVTGERELALVSEAQEIQMGREGDAEVRAQYGVYADEALIRYVASVGEKIVPHTHRPQLDYHFTVLDSPVVNAFALPGGYVYLTRGILALMGSEAELAGVLGHEIGHVTARHAVKRVSQAMLAQFGLAVGSALSETFAQVAGLAGVGIQLLFLKHSRDDERQSDQLGVDYSRKAGYDPSSLIGFFASLREMGDLSGQGTLPGFLSTHPLEEERIENVRGMLVEGDAKLADERAPYLRRLDGLVFGDDPRQGYVDGNTFYHPQFRFTYDFPPKWQTQNSPGQVIHVAPDQNAALLLEAAATDAGLADYARSKASSQLQNARPVAQEAQTINGLDALVQVYDVPQGQQEPLRLRYTFIRKGPTIFTFSALSTVSAFPRYDGAFAASVRTFRELTDRARLNVPVRRLAILRADGRRTLAQIFAAEGVDEKIRPRLAIMNGLKLEAAPSADALIKVVR